MKLPRVKAPRYKNEDVGQWRIRRVDGGYFMRGYASPPAVSPPCYTLSKGSTTWMSTSPLERESHAVHLKHARGTVVVCGVGLGVYLYNLVQNPLVTRVVAVDSDRDILGWCQDKSRGWDGGDKISWLWGDARSIVYGDLHRMGVEDAPDYLYVDIWPSLMHVRTVEDAQDIQRGVKALNVGWWGQELWFALWCANNLRPGEDVTLDTFDEWCLDFGSSVYERSTEYVDYCRRVATNMAEGAGWT